VCEAGRQKNVLSVIKVTRWAGDKSMNELLPNLDRKKQMSELGNTPHEDKKWVVDQMISMVK